MPSPSHGSREWVFRFLDGQLNWGLPKLETTQGRIYEPPEDMARVAGIRPRKQVFVLSICTQDEMAPNGRFHPAIRFLGF